GFKVIIITNQAGVARGYFTEETVREINRYVQESFAREGASIDMFYYCPHHVEGIIEEYRKDCCYRKPNPGMLNKAAKDFNINLKESFVIGDKYSDIEAGYRAGCRNILLRDNNLPDEGGETGVIPDYIAPDLHEAAKWIVNQGYQEK
ncbi:D-glycero-alpha-D-manno-heptose-1,7-bisphosphate 7-phosphatase, partial [Chloroflexota bacterium]